MSIVSVRFKALVGTLASFTADLFNRRMGFITDGPNGGCWGVYTTAWQYHARQDVNGRVLSRGLATGLTPITRIDDAGAADLYTLTVANLTAGKIPLTGAGKLMGDSAMTENTADITSTKKLIAPGFTLVDYAFKKPSYCGLWSASAAAAQSIPNGSTYTKAIPFDTVQAGYGSTPDAVNKQITVDRAGTYRVSWTRTYQVGTNNVNWSVGVLVNGAIAAKSVHEVLTANASVNYYSSTTTHLVLAAGDVLSIGVKHGSASAVTITYLHADFVIEAID